MRKKLVMTLVYALREAENVYYERPDFHIKDTIYDIIKACELTDAERQGFEIECNALGI